MERKPSWRRNRQHVEYGEQCHRCATELPAEASICTMCGTTIGIPMQLPAPRDALAA